MYSNLTQSLTFSPAGFRSDSSCPTPVSERQNTRGFTFFRFLRGSKTWLSLLAWNSLVNIRTILTYGFYVQKMNCFSRILSGYARTVFTEQPLIQNIKERISCGDRLLYEFYVETPSVFWRKLRKQVDSSPSTREGVFSTQLINRLKKMTKYPLRYPSRIK